MCSIHFPEDSFLPDKKRRILKTDAVPTNFPSYPKHLQKRSKPRKPPKDRSIQKITDNFADPNVVEMDHSYHLPNPSELKRRLDQSLAKNDTLRKKVRKLNDSNNQLKKKISSLTEVVNELKEKHIVSENTAEVLEQASSKVPAQVFQRLLESNGKISQTHKLYTKELKAFAITLQFYSNRAYNYVRDTFGLCLPHEQTVRRWYSAIKAEVGFTAESFETLKAKVSEEEAAGREVLVDLMCRVPLCR